MDDRHYELFLVLENHSMSWQRHAARVDELLDRYMAEIDAA